MGGSCGNLISAGATCSNFRATVTVQDNVDGEHRLRFVVGNKQGTAFNRLAGAERVIVVNVKPDLGTVSVDREFPEFQRDHHTTYDSPGPSRFAIEVENTGTYPNWNPNGDNGVELYYGRSSFDAPADNDERPDHKVNGRGQEAGYGVTGNSAH